MFLSEWCVYPSAPFLAGKTKTWWQLASRYCWNRARPWHASELVSFLVGLRTCQHPDSYIRINSALRRNTFCHKLKITCHLCLENHSLFVVRIVSSTGLFKANRADSTQCQHSALFALLALFVCASPHSTRCPTEVSSSEAYCPTALQRTHWSMELNLCQIIVVSTRVTAGIVREPL